MATQSASCSNVQKCSSLKRLIMCLHFYNTIGDYMEEDDDNLLIEYFKQYTDLLNDYGHILRQHLSLALPPQQYQQNYSIIHSQINKYLKCSDVLQCQHYRQNQLQSNSNSKSKINTENHKLLAYYVQMLDCIHVFFAHSTHIAYRVNLEHLKQEENNNLNLVQYTLHKRRELHSTLKLPSPLNINNAYISKASFRGGHRYAFWKWYANNEQLDAVNAGCQYKDWYIAAKYAHLKQELLENQSCALSAEQYETVLFKATQYLQHSDAVKAMQCNEAKLVSLHYDDVIKKEDVLSLQHIIAILLLTDCKAISLAFCKQISQQTDDDDDREAVKQRVSEYAIWYKLVRETVELFGQNVSDCKHVQNWYLPLHSNGDVVLPRYVTRLNHPMFISNSISSAIIDAAGENHKGCILTLRAGDANDDGLSYFNCEYFGCFGYSSANLICGGYRQWMVHSVRTIHDAVNYERFIKPMAFLDHLLNETETASFGVEPTQSDGELLAVMVKEAAKCPNYVRVLFERFVAEFKSIRLNMGVLRKSFMSLVENTLISTECAELVQIGEIAKVFANCEVLEIEMEAGMDGHGKALDEAFYTSLLSEMKSVDEKAKMKEVRVCQIEMSKEKIETLNKQLSEIKWSCQSVVAENKEKKAYFGVSLSIQRL